MKKACHPVSGDDVWMVRFVARKKMVKREESKEKMRPRSV